MSTHAIIAVESNNKVTAVYCHFDGYPSHTGKMLQENFNTQELADALVQMGDMSFLGTSIDNSQFYARDRGEEINFVLKNVDADSLAHALPRRYENYYLFKNGEWLYSTRRDSFPSIKERIMTPQEALNLAEKALAPFAALLQSHNDKPGQNVPVFAINDAIITRDDMRNARAALAAIAAAKEQSNDDTK